MSWKDILKVSLDKEGNKYREPKHLNAVLTGPAMVLAEKARRPIYVLSYEPHGGDFGYMFDTLEEAKEMDKGNNKIITVKETDKKTLMAAFKLYKELAKEERTDETSALNANKTQIEINNYLRGKEDAYAFNVYEELEDAIQRYDDGHDSLEEKKLKEQLKQALKEIDWMDNAH